MMDHGTKILRLLMLAPFFLIAGEGAAQAGPAPTKTVRTGAGVRPHGSNTPKENQMTVKIGDSVFTAALADNETATAFKAMLPLTLKMGDLNDNEKVIRLPAGLPTDDLNPGRIHAGDLMIWDSRNLVLFYKSFPTSYRYTRLGRINDPAGLAAAVGPGSVVVAFGLIPATSR